MRSSPVSAAVWVVLCAGVALGSVGCGPCKPEIRERDIVITLDDALVGQPVELNFYGANASDRDTWQTIPVSEYYKSNNPVRATRDKAIVAFEPGVRVKSRTFQATGVPQWERLWASWKARGAWDLVVLAYIPNSSWSGAPADDPRRLVLPLNQCMWADPSKPIQLRVSRGMITNETPHLTEPRH